MTDPTMHASIDQRLMDLEVKLSFTEDLVDHLNQTVARQQEQIDLLLREVARLRREGQQVAPGPARHPADELPPHY